MTPLLSYLLAASAATVGFLPYAAVWLVLRRRDARPSPMSVTIPPAEKQPARFS